MFACFVRQFWVFPLLLAETTGAAFGHLCPAFRVLGEVEEGGFFLPYRAEPNLRLGWQVGAGQAPQA